MINKRKSTIIVAGGKGERMQTDIPKQFLELNGKPVLMHTLDIFRNFDSKMELILVLPSSQIDYWNILCKKHAFSPPHKIVEGGSTRFHSVKNGLKAVTSDSLIAIHDGVRPLVSHETITDCFVEAGISGAAIPVVDATDSLRKITENGSVAVNRSQYKMVQTPQVFEVGLILDAYNQVFSETFTDDASVVEAFGHKVSLVTGNRENIKITTQIDMLLAKAILESK